MIYKHKIYFINYSYIIYNISRNEVLMPIEDELFDYWWMVQLMRKEEEIYAVIKDIKKLMNKYA